MARTMLGSAMVGVTTTYRPGAEDAEHAIREYRGVLRTWWHDKCQHHTSRRQRAVRSGGL